MSTDTTFTRAINTVRLLAADGVQKANSGHPGMPMGCADYAFTLWSKFLRHRPDNPQWLGRDRFVLSAGHGSMLLYSLLHMFDYGMKIEDLQQFRQWQSLTPGHPEFGHTKGVEVTTGPLGSGFATAVGLAMAAKQLGARLDNGELFNQRVFVISGDGCMMEGTTHEAASLAGHQQLDNLIVFYDDNSITIEGSTDLAFSEDVGARFRAYNWTVLRVDGHNVEQIEAALATATAGNADKPTLIIGKTIIGCGAPNLGGNAEAHGAPLGKAEIAATKAALGFDPELDFHVPADVRVMVAERISQLQAAADNWDTQLQAYLQANPVKAELLANLREQRVPATILDELLAAVPAKSDATRNSSGVILQKVSQLVPCLVGGAADLAPSTKTYVKNEPAFTPATRHGRNFHFGVREMGMALAGNGLALYGTAISYTSTFAVFSDYMKPAIRLAALQKCRQIFVLTHDSIFVGEDGPTHQPIEQLLMLRSIPDMTVIRPAESNEVAHAWATALQLDGPSALLLTRQTVQNFPAEWLNRIDLARGAYILDDEAGFNMILMATGSEVQVAVDAAQQLRELGQKVRVVSMPSLELFAKQEQCYREHVLPKSCTQRISIEAGTTIGWDRYVGDNGLAIGIDHFGASAPAQTLAEKFGIVADAVVARIKAKYL